MPVKRSVKHARTLAIAKRLGLKGTLRYKKGYIRADGTTERHHSGQRWGERFESHIDTANRRINLRYGLGTVREFALIRDRAAKHLKELNDELAKTPKRRFIKRAALKSRIAAANDDLVYKTYAAKYAKKAHKEGYAAYIEEMRARPKPKLP